MQTSFAIRDDLASALDNAWTSLAEAGVWWTGAERFDITRETRHARVCPLCARRKEALSPSAVPGDHDTCTDLPPPAIEAIHRLVGDPGRLSRGWYEGLLAQGLDDVRYVELLSVVAITTAIDTFDAAIGRQSRPLPAVRHGAPMRRRPRGAREGLAWMATLAPQDVSPDDPPLYAAAGRIGGNVHLSLSLVPEAMVAFWDMFETMYLTNAAMRDFDREYRAIDHAQIEMLAARVAVLNRCTY
jgi:hypothetical protein